MALSRRQFFTLMGVGAAGVAIASPLQLLYHQRANRVLLADARWGGLQRDPNGLLDLPAGFRYTVFSKEGDLMTDGNPVPAAHDGMAAFADAEGHTILIRNHELSPNAAVGVKAPSDKQYDPLGKGGTTTLVVSGDRQLIRHYASLAGTVRNCAGGATPWGSWISCEETVAMPTGAIPLMGDGVLKPHGYNFEVPMTAITPVDPEPLVAMGRFNHEAIAVDPRTGIVYQTEDRVDGLLYRFIPHAPGNLKVGGILEALRISSRPQARTRVGFSVGQSVAVDWVRIEEVDPPEDTVRVEGFRKGAAQFARGEGICYSDGQIYFTCTIGGNVPNGQLWRYTPDVQANAGGNLELVVQPDDPSILDFPDNLIMAPWGDLLVCEDGAGEQRIIGVTPDGTLYPFARNALNNSEFAGICCSPDGRTIFLNIYSPGITFAIWSESGEFAVG